MEEARKEAHELLRNVKLSVSIHVAEIERQLQFVKDEKEMMKTQEAGLCRMIKESYEQLRNALLKQEELLCEEMKSHMSELSSSVDSCNL